MVAYSWGIGSSNNQIQTQVRRLLQLLIHNFWLYLPSTDGEVYQYGDTPFAWESIDNNSSTCGLIAMGQALLLIHSDGEMYVRVPNAGWPKVGKALSINSELSSEARPDFFQNAHQVLMEDAQLNAVDSEFQLPTAENSSWSPCVLSRPKARRFGKWQNAR
jgi:hypothetical protein